MEDLTSPPTTRDRAGARWLRPTLVGSSTVVVAVGLGMLFGKGGAGTPVTPPPAAAAPPAEHVKPRVDGPARLDPPPPGSVYMGLHDPDLQRRTLRSVASELGGRPRIVHWFQQWRSGETRFREAWAIEVARQGAVPMITWEPWAKPQGGVASAAQPEVSLARIAAGDHDRYIRQWARATAHYGKPLLLRPMHEMNGHWYPWAVGANGNQTAEFVPAWRRIVDIFRQEAADNVQFVWSVNNDAGAGRTGALAPLYPGEDYVDWVATSAFNWGNSYSWSTWRSAESIVGPTYRVLARYRKPIMVSELGTVATGGSREAWIRDAIVRLRRTMPKIRAVVWYSSLDQAGIDFRVRDLPGIFAPPVATWYAPLKVSPLATLAERQRGGG